MRVGVVGTGAKGSGDVVLPLALPQAPRPVGKPLPELSIRSLGIQKPQVSLANGSGEVMEPLLAVIRPDGIPTRLALLALRKRE